MSDDPPSSNDRTRERLWLWRAVGASVLASVLFILFVQPILPWVTEPVIAVLSFVYSGYLDIAYANAVVNGERLTLLSIQVIFNLVPAVLCIYSTSLVFRRPRSVLENRSIEDLRV
jgi:hypothetical protein